MFLIFLEIHTQFRLTWTPTHTSEWRVIRWLRMFTSGEQLAQMHGLAEWAEVTALSHLTSDSSCSKFRAIEVTRGWNQAKDMHREIGSLCLGNHHWTTSGELNVNLLSLDIKHERKWTIRRQHWQRWSSPDDSELIMSSLCDLYARFNFWPTTMISVSVASCRHSLYVYIHIYRYIYVYIMNHLFNKMLIFGLSDRLLSCKTSRY